MVWTLGDGKSWIQGIIAWKLRIVLDRQRLISERICGVTVAQQLASADVIFDVVTGGENGVGRIRLTLCGAMMRCAAGGEGLCRTYSAQIVWRGDAVWCCQGCLMMTMVHSQPEMRSEWCSCARDTVARMSCIKAVFEVARGVDAKLGQVGCNVSNNDHSRSVQTPGKYVCFFFDSNDGQDQCVGAPGSTDRL